MKKGLTVTMTAALAVSALTPAAAFAAETPATAAKPGLYNIVTGQFYSAPDFKALTKEAQKAVIKDSNFFLVSGGKVYKGLDVITSSQENLAKVATPEATFEAEKNITLTPEGTVLDKDGVVITPEPGTPGDVVVKSVSAINATGVTLSFKALKEDKLGATVTVVNPTGKEVAVKAQDLSAGETEAVFVFEKAYTSFDSIPTGVWKINGTNYDFGAQVAVKTVKEAKNQVELLAALKSAYFTGVNEDLIGEYEGKFGDAATVADVQAEIDKVNKAQSEEVVESAVVKAVVDAKTQPQLLTALNANFDRVNADWIAAYADTVVAGKTLLTLEGEGATGYDAVTTKSIQTIIDNANQAAISTGGTSALVKAEAELSTTSITKAENLINAYVKPDTKDPLVTTKADLLDRVAVHKAVIAVNEASTNNILKTRLAALATTVNDATTFDIKKVNEVLLPEYRAAIATPTSVGKTAADKLTAKTLEDIVVAVNAAELTSAVADVVTNFPTYDETDAADQKVALKELNRLADVSADVDAKDIDANFIENYITDITTEIAKAASGAIDWTSATDAQKAAQIQADITAANGSVVTTAVNTVKSKAVINATDLLAALMDANLGLTNVKDANKDAYFTAAVNKTGVKYFANIADEKDAQKVVNAVNAYVDANKATTATDMRTALTTFAVALDSIGGVNEAPAFINLSTAAKLEVAEIVLNAKKADFTTAYTLGQAVDAAMTKHSAFLSNVNTATDITEMKNALNDKDAFPAFYEATAETKVTKAEAVLNKLAEIRADDKSPAVTNFKTIAEIKTAAGL